MAEAATARPGRQLHWSFYLLGFALGGFFDGILLHQVLQWHHLLSGLEEARHDVRLLILADGLFHLLMYVLAAIGLVLLWRSRNAFASSSDRLTLACALIGFGAWHVADAILSHWVLGIHRVRMDVDNPLLWDLVWLAVFGLVPLVWGIALRRRIDTRSKGLMLSPAALTLGVLASAAVASMPPPGGGPVMVMFGPNVTPQAAFSATQALDAKILWTDPSQQLWALEVPSDTQATGFYALGAVLVSNNIVPLGCLDWFAAKA
ncbi:DUF2243 domain-containing protein [Devosia submarina]|uniref:DUF2243 domain-containing protein n=1 Tax=Devosia submarina TaxID=1173082 RepID=UPI000D38B83E|nr:DUF2243 domain-containing protein [Devosia submarina]